MPSSAEFDVAIATIEDSRYSHVAWRDALKDGHELPHELIGDLAHHQKCIEGYDQVLDVLRRARP
jgi:hypothetical protein